MHEAETQASVQIMMQSCDIYRSVEVYCACACTWPVSAECAVDSIDFLSRYGTLTVRGLVTAVFSPVPRLLARVSPSAHSRGQAKMSSLYCTILEPFKASLIHLMQKAASGSRRGNCYNGAVCCDNLFY